eukprot:scaffold6419_cov116-Cylindrotheca_fusiformis.AAC.1
MTSCTAVGSTALAPIADACVKELCPTQCYTSTETTKVGQPLYVHAKAVYVARAKQLFTISNTITQQISPCIICSTLP